MNATILSLILLSAAAFGQTASETRVYSFNTASSEHEMLELTTAIRSVTDISKLHADTEKKSLTAEGSAAQLALAEWLIQATKAAPGSRTATSYSGFYFNGNPSEPAVRLYFFASREAGKPLHEVAVKVRQTTQIRRLFTLDGPRAIVVRGSDEQMKQADEMIRSMDRN